MNNLPRICNKNSKYSLLIDFINQTNFENDFIDNKITLIGLSFDLKQ